MANGGQTAMRGYLIQTLIALLTALDNESGWLSVTLEPNIESDKVDILWQYPNGTRAIQVKSSQNPYSKNDVERWATELESWREASEYELVIVGTPASPAVARIRIVGSVVVQPPKNLDLRAFSEQAAHRLDGFLRNHDLHPGDAKHRELLAGALGAKLATLSTAGQEITRSALVKLLAGWIGPSREHLKSGKTVKNRKVIPLFPQSSSGDAGTKVIQTATGSSILQAGRDIVFKNSKIKQIVAPPEGTIGANPLLRERIQGLFNDIALAREPRFGKSVWPAMYKTFKADFKIPKNQAWTVIWLWDESRAQDIIGYLEAKSANTIPGRIRRAARRQGHQVSRPQLYARETDLLGHLGMTKKSPEFRALMKEMFGVTSHSDLSMYQHQQLVAHLDGLVRKIEDE